MHTKKQNEEFSMQRRHRKDAARTPLLRSVTQAKDLEKHVKDFMVCLSKDKKCDPDEMLQSIHEFEEGLFEEFHQTSKELQREVSKTLGTLKKWSELKDLTEKMTGKKHHLASSKLHDMKLAEALVKSIHTKLESIEKIGSRLK